MPSIGLWGVQMVLLCVANNVGVWLLRCFRPLPHSVGARVTLPISDGCMGRGTSVVGAVDRGCASTTYDIPSSDTYEGGRGPDRVLGLS
jgi:hypothetical protein